ncbi:MAG: response regulator, partial [Elusimicrobia bacterium]|nr:response regulator [Elusimicrobiota bacterium]
MMLKEFFELEGYEVLQASDGVIAAGAAAEYLPDLITMDMRMPGTPGLEAVRAIRSNPKTKHIPILMCTGENKVEDIDESLRAGADDY